MSRTIIIIPSRMSASRLPGKPLLEKVELLDTYQGNNIDNDKCSLTFRMYYRDTNKTLPTFLMNNTDLNVKKIYNHIFLNKNP